MEMQVNTVYIGLDVYDNMRDIINNQERQIEVRNECIKELQEEIHDLRVSENGFADALYNAKLLIIKNECSYGLKNKEIEPHSFELKEVDEKYHDVFSNEEEIISLYKEVYNEMYNEEFEEVIVEERKENEDGNN